MEASGPAFHVSRYQNSSDCTKELHKISSVETIMNDKSILLFTIKKQRPVVILNWFYFTTTDCMT